MGWRRKLCFVFVFCVGVYADLNCDSLRTKPLKFSISSRRNLTGHWIAQVQFQHGADDKETGPWDVDIERTTTKCHGFETVQIVATVTAPSSTPKLHHDLGYDLVPGFGYYKLHTDVKTWDDALQTCEQEGAHLVIINSEAEAKALAPFWDANPKILEGAPNDWAHAGFHDKYKEGQYLTIFNETLVAAGYVKWYPGDPHGVNQNCGLVIRNNNVLADIGCQAKQPFFCEIEL